MNTEHLNPEHSSLPSEHAHGEQTNTTDTALPNEHANLSQDNSAETASQSAETASQSVETASQNKKVKKPSIWDDAKNISDFTLPKEYKPVVLVVDDMPKTASLLALMLQEQDMVVHSATTGAEGIEQAIKLIPDLILLDVDLPDVNGFEVCKKLGETKATSTIPVIMITGQMVGQEDAARGFAVGAVDYVLKPFVKDELVARINTHIDLARLKNLYRQQKLDARVDSMQQKKLNLNSKALVMESHANVLARIHRELNKVLLSNDMEAKNLRLKKTLFLIQQELQLDVSFTDLEKRFRGVNIHYKQVLLKYCPSLSPKEIQLCMLLRLGYSTKQICRIQGVLAPSIDAYRYRLRLKFKLVAKDNLVTHLVNILG
jgi:DNA-binding response OmpR family regulator/DNA-binding CsgD family transcriptional regulator